MIDPEITTTIADGELYVVEVPDLNGVRLAIGRPTGHKRPAILMWNGTSRHWIVVGRFNSELAALAVVRFTEQMAEQINRATDFLENMYQEKLNRLDQPGDTNV